MVRFVPPAKIVKLPKQELILPNNSGDHTRGIKRETPIADIDIANKKYVDDSVAGLGTWTDTSTNTGTNKTFNSSTNDVHADELHAYVRNTSGSTIAKGKTVYISGYNVGLDIAEIELADSDGVGTYPASGS